MMGQIRHVDLSDLSVLIPVFLTVTVMPLTYSIANGIGAGFVSWVLIQALSGRARRVSPLLWIVAAGFVVFFARGPWRRCSADRWAGRAWMPWHPGPFSVFRRCRRAVSVCAVARGRQRVSCRGHTIRARSHGATAHHRVISTRSCDLARRRHPIPARPTDGPEQPRTHERARMPWHPGPQKKRNVRALR